MRIQGEINSKAWMEAEITEVNAHKRMSRIMGIVLSGVFGSGKLELSSSVRRNNYFNWEYNTEAPGLENHSVPTKAAEPNLLPDAEFIDAVRIARVHLCNVTSVYLDTKTYKYVPKDPTDENAAHKCRAINRLESFLSLYPKPVRSSV